MIIKKIEKKGPLSKKKDAKGKRTTELNILLNNSVLIKYYHNFF